jgi:hypothetical protein
MNFLRTKGISTRTPTRDQVSGLVGPAITASNTAIMSVRIHRERVQISMVLFMRHISI